MPLLTLCRIFFRLFCSGFNFLLEMPMNFLAMWPVNRKSLFQFSIGDAISAKCNDSKLHQTHVSILYWRCIFLKRKGRTCPEISFQFSIGDAHASRRRRRHALRRRAGFNSLLEMPAINAISAMMICPIKFQFSIGDADQPVCVCSAYVVRHQVSILYWRCGDGHGAGGWCIRRCISILYWRCGK